MNSEHAVLVEQIYQNNFKELFIHGTNSPITGPFVLMQFMKHFMLLVKKQIGYWKAQTL